MPVHADPISPRLAKDYGIYRYIKGVFGGADFDQISHFEG